jgi:mRNA-degrading endonuclease toxin of MazEF toxin-antitoxin module
VSPEPVRRGQLRRLQTVAAGPLLVAVVSSDEMHEATSRALVARITNDEEAADTGVSVPIPPGLGVPGWIMPDRLMEVRQRRLGDASLGELPPATIDHLDVALAVVLGLRR